MYVRYFHLYLCFYKPYLAWRLVYWLAAGGRGVKFTPLPLYFLIYTFDSFLESPTSIICKTNGKFVKIQIFIAKSSYKAKNVQKYCANCSKLQICENPLTSAFKWKFKKKWKCANSLYRRLCKNLWKISHLWSFFWRTVPVWLTFYCTACSCWFKVSPALELNRKIQ